MKWVVLSVFLLLLRPGLSTAQERHVVASMGLPAPVTAWYFNPDGSCVQLSIGICGVYCNDMNAASLPFDSAYGPAVRGGSIPSRVSNYCNRRGIQAWNVTGPTTLEWARFAVDTGRYAAIGLGTQHFQTIYGYDYTTKEWLVCNNQTPKQIDRYSEAEFARLHQQSGLWIVVLKRPSSPAPEYVDWNWE